MTIRGTGISSLAAVAATILLLMSPVNTTAQYQPTFPDIQYAYIDSTRLLLDIYPALSSTSAKPAIVWIHGGAWSGGSKEDFPCAWLIGPDYVLVSISYRLSQQAFWPAQIHDCKAAIRWLRAHASSYGIDPDRIGVWGSSAGGHLAAALGTMVDDSSLEGTVGGNRQYSSRVQAVCDWFGPANFRTIADYPSTIDFDYTGSPVSLLLGLPVPYDTARAASASPISHITGNEPPFLIMHGTADSLVPYHQSVELDSALRRAGSTSTFITLPGAGHGGGLFDADSTRARVKAFFDATLRPGAGVRDERSRGRRLAMPGDGRRGDGSQVMGWYDVQGRAIPDDGRSGRFYRHAGPMGLKMVARDSLH
jgi:acetyl esterase/lipase